MSNVWKNYFNDSGIINNTYINCYFNDTSNQVYIDTSINNLEENFINTINIYNNTNSILTKEIEIKNRTELIENMINNIFQQLNISNIDNGEDEINNIINNISILITSTKNKKKKEIDDIITIDICKCENILKRE